MSKYRYAGLDNALDRQADFHPAFHFYSMGMAFLHNSSDILKRLVYAAMISHEWHIRHNKCMLSSSLNRPGVIYHIINSYRNR
ncbi:hypothetical protein D3C81_1320490 [compost metagenome]